MLSRRRRDLLKSDSQNTNGNSLLLRLDYGRAVEIRVRRNGVEEIIQGQDLADATVSASITKAGNLRPTKAVRRLGNAQVVMGLIYGLVNVRTDGDTILCATMNEKDATWQVKKIRSRF